MGNLIKKTVSTLKNDGFKGVSKKARVYTAAKLLNGINEPAPEDAVVEEQNPSLEINSRFVDVIFINGCGSLVPHPSRYRVTHQREQLAANGFTSDEVYYTDLNLDYVKYAHTFIFFRCPHTEMIEEFVKLAKSVNKTILFDIDDLVVDTKYTDKVKYVQGLSEQEKNLYDDGVNRMGKTLKLCEGAITTTERLATELGKYVPEVFINRNTASERMFELSENATVEREDDEVRIGYFSGSITHNDDFNLVLPAIVKLLDKYDNVRLYIVGELDLPEELQKYSDKVVVSPFMDWQELPGLIASVDINIAPLEDTIFNEAKSENKWVEAALVKVVTVASNVGAFKNMIKNGETGVLCENHEWYDALDDIIANSDKRDILAENAYKYVKENCTTINTGRRITEFIKSKVRPTILLSLPSTEISGGIMVALKHAKFLYEEGFEVTVMASNPSLEWIEYEGVKFPVVSSEQCLMDGHFDKGIATMWVTAPFIAEYPKLKDRYYLVQGYEVDFYKPNVPLRIEANATYNLQSKLKYVTISKWCQGWLESKYGIKAEYAPNGIDVEKFYPCDRDYSGKIRILIEGDCAVDYKKVDESFEIANRLDKDKFEVWYMSYNETPKEWYQIDKFLHRVPYAEVPDVYRQCHILLKSSTFESFSYPPLEMMATGGCVVVVENDGNAEYIKDGYNCLIYESGDVEGALEKLRINLGDYITREALQRGAIQTAQEYEWSKIRNDILGLYDI